MDARAKITSRAQVPTPKARDSLDLLAHARTVPVPAGKKGTAWRDVLRDARRDRAKRRH